MRKPQIKISDLSSIPIIQDTDLQNKIGNLCKQIYNNSIEKNNCMYEINNLIYHYYDLNCSQIATIEKEIKFF